MNYAHVIVPSRRFIYQVFEGEFSLDQLIACTRRLWNDPDYSKHYNGITDISRMAPSQALDKLQGLMLFLKSQPQTSQGRWAVITSTPMSTAGAMVYKRDMATHHPFGVFSTWESACAFLQLDLAAPPASAFFTDLADTPLPPAS